MGVYINMEMPKSCGDCRFCGGIADTDCGPCAWCDVDGKARVADTRQDCPLVPVPPHGRLGDLDKQDVQIEALIERHLHGYTKSTWDFICELRDILKHNPTVIPKESAEEEKK